MPISVLAKKEYWHLDQITQCSYRNEKLSPSTLTPCPSPPQGESFWIRTLLHQKRDNRKWQAGGSHWGKLRTWRMEVEKQNYFVPLSFPMEMNILVSCQRRAINISSR